MSDRSENALFEALRRNADSIAACWIARTTTAAEFVDVFETVVASDFHFRISSDLELRIFADSPLFVDVRDSLLDVSIAVLPLIGNARAWRRIDPPVHDRLVASVPQSLRDALIRGLRHTLQSRARHDEVELCAAFDAVVAEIRTERKR
jgi:hypothetical protein